MATLATFQYKEAVVKKLFDEIAPEYASRPGGYTCIIRTGPRRCRRDVHSRVGEDGHILQLVRGIRSGQLVLSVTTDLVMLVGVCLMPRGMVVHFAPGYAEHSLVNALLCHWRRSATP